MATQALVAGRPASELSPAEQRAAYDDNGYLVFPTLLDAGELATLRARARRSVVRSRRSDRIQRQVLGHSNRSDGYSVRRIFNPIAHHQAFEDLISIPRFSTWWRI